MDLAIVTSVVADRSVVSLRGEIDLSTLPTLYDGLARITTTTRADATPLIIDLDGVSACDDAGLGVLLGCAGRLRSAGRELIVVCSGESMRARLARTGFDRAVQVAASISAASID